MILKVGLLVLCQFYWGSENLQLKEGEKAPEPHRVVGTIKAIHPQKNFSTVVRNGTVYALANEKTLLEIQGKEPNYHYFINAASCVPVRSQEDLDKEFAEEKAQADALKAKEEKKAKESSSKVTEQKVEESNVEKAVKAAASLNVQDTPVSKVISAINGKDPTPAKAEKEENHKKEPVLIPIKEEKKEEPKKVNPISLGLGAPSVKEVKEEAPPAAPVVEEEKTKEKDSKDSVVKGILKDIFNQ